MQHDIGNVPPHLGLRALADRNSPLDLPKLRLTLYLVIQSDRTSRLRSVQSRALTAAKHTQVVSLTTLDSAMAPQKPISRPSDKPKTLRTTCLRRRIAGLSSNCSHPPCSLNFDFSLPSMVRRLAVGNQHMAGQHQIATRHNHQDRTDYATAGNRLT